MGWFAHPATIRNSAELYRQRVASAAEPSLRDAYEQLADAFDAMAHWHDIAEGVQRVVDELVRRGG